MPHGRGDLSSGPTPGRNVPGPLPRRHDDDCILDPGIAPLGSDSEGNIHRLVAAMERIHADPFFAGCHASVGLSNFTVMLPTKRPDGSPVKGPLKTPFLTKVMPLGLDMVIGSVKRNYELLGPDQPAMQCLDDCLKRTGFDVLMRVREFYTSSNRGNCGVRHALDAACYGEQWKSWFRCVASRLWPREKAV